MSSDRMGYSVDSLYVNEHRLYIKSNYKMNNVICQFASRTITPNNTVLKVLKIHLFFHFIVQGDRHLKMTGITTGQAT